MSGWLSASAMSLTERHNVWLVINISHELDRDMLSGWINISHELDIDIMSGW